MIIGLLSYLFLSDIPTKIVISDKTIKEAIEKKLPIEKEKLGSKIIISDAEVDLNNVINIKTKGKVETMGKTIDFNATTVGMLRFENGNFYFSPQDVQIKLGNVSEEKPTIKSKLFDKAVNFSKSIGIDKSAVENSVAEHVKENVTDIPLYKQEGVLKASIKNVYIEGDNVVIEASVMEFLKTVIIGIIVFILAIALVFAMVSSGGFLVFGLASSL